MQSTLWPLPWRAISLLFFTINAQGVVQINTPTGVTQCSPVLFTWTSGTVPYTLKISTTTSANIVESLIYASIQDTSYTSQLYWPAGTKLTATVTGAQGVSSQTSPFSIGAGTNSSCIMTFKTNGNDATEGTFNFDTPLGPYSTCDATTSIKWHAGVPPYGLLVESMNLAIAVAQAYENLTATDVDPTIHIPSGTAIRITVQDSTGESIISPEPITITKGSDTSCTLSNLLNAPGSGGGFNDPISLPAPSGKSNPASSSSKTQSSAKGTSTSDNNNNNNNNNNNKVSKSGKTPVVPIVIGVVVAGIVSIALTVLLIRWKRRRRLRGEQLESSNSGGSGGDTEPRDEMRGLNLGDYRTISLENGPGELVLQPSTFNPTSDTKEVHLYPPTNPTPIQSTTSLTTTNPQTQVLRPVSTTPTSIPTTPTPSSQTSSSSRPRRKPRRAVYHVDGGPVEAEEEEEEDEDHFPPAYQDLRRR